MVVGRWLPKAQFINSELLAKMSLKHFHIVFIVIAVLCCLGFGAWALISDEGSSSGTIRATGWLSLVLGTGLAGYGAWFYRKSKRVIT